MEMATDMNMTTLAELGVLLQAYLSVKTLISIDWTQSFNQDWYNYVKNQVLILNNRFMDEEQAFDLLDKQNYMCKKCNADLSMDRQPTLECKETQNTFLGMQTISRRFVWVCKTCCSSKGALRKDRMEDLNKRIETYTSQMDPLILD